MRNIYFYPGEGEALAVYQSLHPMDLMDLGISFTEVTELQRWVHCFDANRFCLVFPPNFENNFENKIAVVRSGVGTEHISFFSSNT